MTTRKIRSSELAAGMIIHFHGARFRLRDDVKVHTRPADHRDADLYPVFTATGDWIDGEIVNGYFGPSAPWRFQGNDRAAWCAEAPPIVWPPRNMRSDSDLWKIWVGLGYDYALAMTPLFEDTAYLLASWVLILESNP